MSQIDQAFIKAYRQQTSQPMPAAAPTTSSQPATSRPAAPQPAAPLASSTSAGGVQFRVDAAHQPQQPTSGARVPTPHLRLPQGQSATTAAPATAEPAPVNVSQVRVPAQRDASATVSSVWSPRSRMSQATRSRLESQQPSPEPMGEPAEQSTAPATPPFVSIEETLLRLEGVAPQQQDQQQGVEQGAGDTCSIVEEAAEETTSEETTVAPVTVQGETKPALKLVNAEPITKIELPRNEQPEPAEQPFDESSDETNAAIVETPLAEPLAEPTPPETTPEANEVPETTTDIASATETRDDTADDSAQTPSFQAVWEVDAFQWPEVIDRLREAANAELATAGNRLANSARSGAKLLAITGAAEGSGATTLALTLARDLAATGMQVALVDANFGRPMLAERLGVRVQDGWEAALTGSLPLEEVCITSIGDGVTLVPLVDGSGTTATQASLHAAGLLTRLAQVFDIVLIDAGSGSENVAAVATSSDGVLDVPVLVTVDDRRQDRPHTLEMIGHLKQCALDKIQVAQTFAA